MDQLVADRRSARVLRADGKSKTLVIQNVVSGKTLQKIDLKTVDGPESPAFSPDGTKMAFSALQGAVGDIFVVDLATRQITNVTKDAFADYAPSFAPGRTDDRLRGAHQRQRQALQGRTWAAATRPS